MPKLPSLSDSLRFRFNRLTNGQTYQFRTDIPKISFNPHVINYAMSCQMQEEEQMAAFIQRWFNARLAGIPPGLAGMNQRIEEQPVAINNQEPEEPGLEEPAEA